MIDSSSARACYWRDCMSKQCHWNERTHIPGFRFHIPHQRGPAMRIVRASRAKKGQTITAYKTNHTPPTTRPCRFFSWPDWAENNLICSSNILQTANPFRQKRSSTSLAVGGMGLFKLWVVKKTKLTRWHGHHLRSFHVRSGELLFMFSFWLLRRQVLVLFEDIGCLDKRRGLFLDEHEVQSGPRNTGTVYTSLLYLGCYAYLCTDLTSSLYFQRSWRNFHRVVRLLPAACPSHCQCQRSVWQS